MKHIVEIRDVKLGEGKPKICVPLVGKDNEALLKEIKYLKTLCFDIVEWRMDYHEKVEEIKKMEEVVYLLRNELGDVPLLATFRSKKEGGERAVSDTYYKELNKVIIATGQIDLIDVELFMGEEIVSELVEYAHNRNVKVIISNHDFNQTPKQDEIVKRLCKMQTLGADLPKIAVMPESSQDVLTLLSATNEMVTEYANCPIITMSMSGVGVVSRLAGEIFGSALTFGAAREVSAPGQIPVEKLSGVLQIIHDHN